MNRGFPRKGARFKNEYLCFLQVPSLFHEVFHLFGQIQTVFQSLVGPLCWSLHHDDLHMVFRLQGATIAIRFSHAKREGNKLAPVIILLGISKQRERIS